MTEDGPDYWQAQEDEMQQWQDAMDAEFNELMRELCDENE